LKIHLALLFSLKSISVPLQAQTTGPKRASYTITSATPFSHLGDKRKMQDVKATRNSNW